MPTSPPSGSSTSTVGTLSGRPCRGQPPTQAGSAAGFSDGEPWLPVHPDAERLAVGAQTGDPASTLELYRALIALRRAEPALREGTHRSVDAAPDVFAFVREHDRRQLLVALNFAPFPRPLPAEAAGGRCFCRLGTIRAAPSCGPTRAA